MGRRRQRKTKGTAPGRRIHPSRPIHPDEHTTDPFMVRWADEGEAAPERASIRADRSGDGPARESIRADRSATDPERASIRAARSGADPERASIRATRSEADPERASIRAAAGRVFALALPLLAAAGRHARTAGKAGGRGLLTAARAIGRALVAACRRLAATDWRDLARRTRRNAGRARIRARRFGQDVVRAGRAIGRGLLATARVLAVALMTLAPATLFVGAVLLATGYEVDATDRRASTDDRDVRRSQDQPPHREGRPDQDDQAIRSGRPDPKGPGQNSLAKTRGTRRLPGKARGAQRSSATQATSNAARQDASALEWQDYSGPGPKAASRRPGPEAGTTSGRAAPDAASTSGRPDARPAAARAPRRETATQPATPAPASPDKPPSCSAGTRVTGPLHHPARLPDEGPGFARHFPHRHLAWGTDEVVGALFRAAAALHDPALPPLMIGNLSGPEGDQAGADPFHPARYSRGHGAGRAADLLFFVTDALGRPTPAAESNLAFDARGRSEAGVRRVYLEAGAPLPAGCHPSRRRGDLVEAACPVPAGAWRIDFDRTWQLVRALLTDPEIGVVDPETGISRRDGEGLRFIFVAEPHKARLLDAARAAGEPEAFLEIAAVLLHPPSNAPAYDRFLHFDVWCTDADRAACACDDGAGPWNRWRAGVAVLTQPQVTQAKLPAAARSTAPGPSRLSQSAAERRLP